jgi:DNA/RNA endonuclease YhcR with UshA esterase domain
MPRSTDVKPALLTLLFGAVALAVSTSAHHSYAAHYVEDQSVSIEGELVQVEYRNPHSWVHVNARDETGVMRQVAAEWASAPRLKQSGVSEETLKPGDRVIITGSPSRNPTEYTMHLKSIQRRADGWQWSGPAVRR